MKSISKISLLVLLILSVIIGIVFYAAGSSGSIEVGGESLDIPTYTETLMNWAYFLMGLTVFVTLVSAVMQYIQTIKVNPKNAIKSVVSVGLLIVVLLVSFFVGSGEKMDIIGYEGVDNEGFWAQFSEMCLYSMYVLVAIALLAIVGTSVFKKIKK